MAGIDGGAAGTEFVGSKEKAKNQFGQNGYQGARKEGPGPGGGPVKPNIPDVSPPTPVTANANATYDDARLAQIVGHPIKAHDSMRSRGLDDTGSPTGKIPTANVRRSRTDGIGRPTK